MHTFENNLWIGRPVPEVFAFFADARNLERITPPFLQFRILTPGHIEMRPGAQIEYSLRVHGIPLRWLTEIEEWRPPHEFVDVQKKGPYKVWHHTHRFTESGGGTMVTDRVRYELPFGILGTAIERWQVRGDVEAIFRYREEQIRALLR